MLHGETWTRDLCMKDSDGDGMTNGQELGDPSCIWKPGDTPARQTELSHPGVCDPWSSPTCSTKEMPNSQYGNQKSWMKDVCRADRFDCPSINNPGVIKKDLKFDSVLVPKSKTTYICQIFEFPEGAYHVVAVEPIIDNTDVIHHVALFGCQDDHEVWDGPFHCGLVPNELCSLPVLSWSVGLSGMCYNNQSGLPIGDGGFKKLIVQLHWFNPEEKAGFVDSSGLTLYYTPHKRPNDISLITTGTTYFQLLPRQERVSVKGNCSETCTRNGMRNGPIYVTSAWNHMHILGIAMRVEIRRNKSHLLYLTDEKDYRYVGPSVYSYEPPIEIQPGDEIITECWFNTMERNTTVYFGQETIEEMCFAFITYYPRQNFPLQVDYCSNSILNKTQVLKCDPSTYQECPDLFLLDSVDLLVSSSFFQDIVDSCKSYAPCRKDCVQTIVKHRKTNPCLQGNNFEVLKRLQFPSSVTVRYFLKLLLNCDDEVNKILNPGPHIQ